MKTPVKIALYALTAAVGLGFALLVFAFISFMVVFDSMATERPGPPWHFELDRVSDPVKNVDYVLVTNGRKQDKGWSVHRTATGAKLDQNIYHTELPTLLFWNYTESANHFTNEKLELVAGRYLIFSRGGVKHSLYDTQTEEVLFNMESPWHEYPAGRGRPTREEFHAWALTAMDGKIEAIVNERLVPSA